jgi:hypothetical protein
VTVMQDLGYSNTPPITVMIAIPRTPKNTESETKFIAPSHYSFGKADVKGEPDSRLPGRQVRRR